MSRSEERVDPTGKPADWFIAPKGRPEKMDASADYLLENSSRHIPLDQTQAEMLEVFGSEGYGRRGRSLRRLT